MKRHPVPTHVILSALILGPADVGRTVALHTGDELVIRLTCGPADWWSIQGGDGQCPLLTRSRISEFTTIGRHRMQELRFTAQAEGECRLVFQRAAGTGPAVEEIVFRVRIEPR